MFKTKPRLRVPLLLGLPPTSGVLFLAMAFFLFLPMIILAPAKFAMTFSIGSGEVPGAPAAPLCTRHTRQSLVQQVLPVLHARAHMLAWPISISLSSSHCCAQAADLRCPRRATHAALLIASLGALKGWKAMFGHLLSKERLPFAGGEPALGRPWACQPCRRT